MNRKLKIGSVRMRLPKALRVWNAFLLLAATLLLSLFFAWQDNDLVVTNYTYESEKVPAGFSGYTIVQLSDLHSKAFGENQAVLIEKIKAAQPDMIVITGDLIDRRLYQPEPVLQLVNQLPAIAPVYYINGNHEALSPHYGELKKKMLAASVQVLDNQTVQVRRGADIIELTGLQDPFFQSKKYHPLETSKMAAALSNMQASANFTLVLSHRPDLMYLYKKYSCDLVLCGHVHGGQVRLPFVGGLFGASAGMFPHYDAGRFDEKQTTMYVSRGLGNSLFPARVFNRPELVVVTLQRPI